MIGQSCRTAEAMQPLADHAVHAVAPLARRLAAALLAGFLCAEPGSDATAAERPEKLVFVFSRGPADPYTRWLHRLYNEALGRIGIRFEFLEVPPNRATALSSEGLVDGELGRTYEFAELYPTLVRVEEPNNLVLFSAYAVKPLEPIVDWAALRRSAMTVAYRAGIKEIESELQDRAYGGRATSVSSIFSGLSMLQRGSVDLYLDVQNAVDPYLASADPRLSADPGARPRVVAVLQRTTGHAYLHQRHRALAGELAAVLRAMKSAGLHRRYLVDALAADATARGLAAGDARAEAEAVAKTVLGDP